MDWPGLAKLGPRRRLAAQLSIAWIPYRPEVMWCSVRPDTEVPILMLEHSCTFTPGCCRCMEVEPRSASSNGVLIYRLEFDLVPHFVLCLNRCAGSHSHRLF